MLGTFHRSIREPVCHSVLNEWPPVEWHGAHEPDEPAVNRFHKLVSHAKLLVGEGEPGELVCDRDDLSFYRARVMATPKCGVVGGEILRKRLEHLVNRPIRKTVEEADELRVGVLEGTDNIPANRLLVVVDHGEINGTQRVDRVTCLF